MLEIIITLAIIAATCIASLPTLRCFAHQVSANINLRQIQQALAYARSLAIATQQNVIVCPSYNKYSCCGSWRQGILVSAPNGEFKYFSTYLQAKTLIELHASGLQLNKVEIQANGMTYTNGHFIIKSINAGDMPQYNLYFNRGIRPYLRVDGYE